MMSPRNENSGSALIGENNFYDNIISDAINLYKRNMDTYLNDNPKIPPTVFELKCKHATLTKSAILMIHRRVGHDHLDQMAMAEMESCLEYYIKESLKQKARCQMNFALGWKSSMK